MRCCLQGCYHLPLVLAKGDNVEIVNINVVNPWRVFFIIKSFFKMNPTSSLEPRLKDSNIKPRCYMSHVFLLYHHV